MRLLLLPLLLLLSCTGTTPLTSLAGHQLLRTFPTTEEQVEALTKLGERLHLDFWSPPAPGRAVDLHLAPDQRAAVMDLLGEQGVSSEVLQGDLQHLVAKEPQQLAARRGGGMDWTSYHDQADMEALAEELAASRDWVALERIGESFEGRAMRVVAVCRGGCGGKPAVWVDGGMHAREWITPAVVTFLMKELVEEDARHPALTRDLDWYFLPVANPDGYAYSRSTDRLWRKTRSNNSCGAGEGADPNRNWDFHWGEVGASSDPCSELYMGAEAFSEVETRNIRDFILAHKDTIKFYNSIHAYGQQILLPFANTKQLPSNYETMKEVADMGNSALQAVHGREYEVGGIACILYPISGDSGDWALARAGVPLALGMELRGGAHGFLLPAAQILPTAQEVWAFHRAVAEYVIDHPEVAAHNATADTFVSCDGRSTAPSTLLSTVTTTTVFTSRSKSTSLSALALLVVAVLGLM